MTPEHLTILIETNERIASARLILAEAEAYKALVLSYLAQVKLDIVDSQTQLQELIIKR